MSGYHSKSILGVINAMAILFVIVMSVSAQTTSFTYQGNLTDSGNPANGVYDLQFRLLDALSGGNQIGSTIVRDDVTVANGDFSVTLDFGAGAFPGADRWLEISVRPGAGTGAFTPLSPLQPINSTPYAIRSLSASVADGLSAACVNCVTSSQIANLPASSGNYIQNTTTQQTASNFNISGDGTVGGTLSAGAINATTQFNLGGSRILSNAGLGNFFAGGGAGMQNTTGVANTFAGSGAGTHNTTGVNNTFVGTVAGTYNTVGLSNSFFGSNAGVSSQGSNNTFIGAKAGDLNMTGSNNTTIGFNANVTSGDLEHSAAIGADAVVGCSFCMVLGSGVNVGIGTSTPTQTLQVHGSSEILSSGPGAGFKFRDRGSNLSTDDWVWFSSGNKARFWRNGANLLVVTPDGKVGIGTTDPGDKLTVVATTTNGVNSFSAAGDGLVGRTTAQNFSGTSGFNDRTGAGSIGYGTFGLSNAETGSGVWGDTQTRIGVYGSAATAPANLMDNAIPGIKAGVAGFSNLDYYSAGVYGKAVGGVDGDPPSYSAGVIGVANPGSGVEAYGGISGVAAYGSNTGVIATGGSLGLQVTGLQGRAAYFDGSSIFYGDVHVNGVLSKSGGSFKIDHPLDPDNKYLSHSFVESPDMMNIYNGNVITDAGGDAIVTLPDWFGALNSDFRYQLTVIGQFAQAIISEEIADNRFKIKTNMPNVKVSWQVTGIRQDAWAKNHRIPVEEDKPAKEQGRYLHPELFGQSEEKGMNWAINPEMMKQLREMRENGGQPGQLFARPPRSTSGTIRQ